MFIVALFTIARTWKQPKCRSADEWIKMWCIYTMEYYSAIKRNGTKLFVVSWVDLETIIEGEVRKRKTKQISYINACMWNLEKMVQMNLFAE